MSAPLTLRRAEVRDLPAINALIESAIETWDLPERVRRLSLPSYLYQPIDLQSMQLVVLARSLELVGVAAWEPADPRQLPEGQPGLLLHGIYVLPGKQHQGLGRRLLEAAGEAVREQGLNGLLVRAQPQAVGFFERMGMRSLPVQDPSRDYPHRFWWSVRQV